MKYGLSAKILTDIVWSIGQYTSVVTKLKIIENEQNKWWIAAEDGSFLKFLLLNALMDKYTETVPTTRVQSVKNTRQGHSPPLIMHPAFTNKSIPKRAYLNFI